MTDERDDEHDSQGGGLYVTAKEIGRRLGFGERFMRRKLLQLEKRIPGRKPYPQPDPLFDNRYFWPEVLQWHLDYHRVRVAEASAPSIQPKWEENFDPPSRETGRRERPRAHLASS